MRFIKLETLNSVEEEIIEFLPCFPHLIEKIDDIHSYSLKLHTYAEVYVLDDQGIKKGISVFYANDKEKNVGYVSLIGVKQKFQKMGYGRIIIEFTHDVMKKSGMKYSKLEVDNDNMNAYDFYLHEGYSVISNTISTKSSYLLKKL